MAGIQRTPPRFVPTLTVVVEELPAAAADMRPAAPVDQRALPAAQAAVPPLLEAEAFRLEEQLLHRLLQRIDLSLEERLTDTVSAAVQQQLDTMLPQLRAEIEQLLRAVVVEALTLELSQDPGSALTPGPETFG